MLIRYPLALLASCLILAGSAESATYTLTPTLAAAYTPDFNEIPGFEPNTYVGPPVILQIDFLLSFQSADSTFGAIVFDIDFQGLSDNQGLPGWHPHNPPVDSNGPGQGGVVPLFATPGNFPSNTLHNVSVGIVEGITTDPRVDPRLMVGRGVVHSGVNLDLLGSVFAHWDGKTPGVVDVTIVAAGIRRPSDGVLLIDPDPTFIAGTLEINPLPQWYPSRQRC